MLNTAFVQSRENEVARGVYWVLRRMHEIQLHSRCIIKRKQGHSGCMGLFPVLYFSRECEKWSCYVEHLIAALFHIIASQSLTLRKKQEFWDFFLACTLLHPSWQMTTNQSLKRSPEDANRLRLSIPLLPQCQTHGWIGAVCTGLCPARGHVAVDKSGQ